MKRQTWLTTLFLAACAAAAGCTSTQSLGSQSGAVTCSPTTACPKGLSCVSGSCESCGPPPGSYAPEIACKTDHDCPSGLLCVDGVCSGCSDPCTAGGGVLACPAPGADGGLACKSDCDCPDGLFCISGTCGTGCTCPPGEVCGCPDGAPKDCSPTCTNDSECGAGSYCCNGKCEIDTLPCSISADAGTACVGICPSGEYCCPGEGCIVDTLTCPSPAPEAGPPTPGPCTSDADCPSTDYCCDGKCIVNTLVCGVPAPDAGPAPTCGGVVCPSGDYCCNDKCTIDTLPCSTSGLDGGTSSGGCKVNSDCSFGEYCCIPGPVGPSSTGTCKPSGEACPV